MTRIEDVLKKWEEKRDDANRFGSETPAMYDYFISDIRAALQGTTILEWHQPDEKPSDDSEIVCALMTCLGKDYDPESGYPWAYLPKQEN